VFKCIGDHFLLGALITKRAWGGLKSGDLLEREMLIQGAVESLPPELEVGRESLILAA